jgi:uncharacterized Fe-S cluster-containing radical SAM superfamily protein
MNEALIKILFNSSYTAALSHTSLHQFQFCDVKRRGRWYGNEALLDLIQCSLHQGSYCWAAVLYSCRRSQKLSQALDIAQVLRSNTEPRLEISPL